MSLHLHHWGSWRHVRQRYLRRMLRLVWRHMGRFRGDNVVYIQIGKVVQITHTQWGIVRVWKRPQKNVDPPFELVWSNHFLSGYPARAPKIIHVGNLVRLCTQIKPQWSFFFGQLPSFVSVARGGVLFNRMSSDAMCYYTYYGFAHGCTTLYQKVCWNPVCFKWLWSL